MFHDKFQVKRHDNVHVPMACHSEWVAECRAGALDDTLVIGNFREYRHK